MTPIDWLIVLAISYAAFWGGGHNGTIETMKHFRKWRDEVTKSISASNQSIADTLNAIQRVIQQGPPEAVSDMSVLTLASRLTDVDRELRELRQDMINLARHIGAPEPREYTRPAFMDLVPEGFVTDPRMIGKTLRNLLPQEVQKLRALEAPNDESDARQTDPEPHVPVEEAGTADHVPDVQSGDRHSER